MRQMHATGEGGKTAATRWQRTAGATHILVATSEGGCGFRTQTAVRLLVAERDASQLGEVESRNQRAHTKELGSRDGPAQGTARVPG